MEPQVKPDDMHSVLLHSAHVTYYGMMVGLLDFQGDAVRRYGSSRTAKNGGGTGKDGAGASREGMAAEKDSKGGLLGGLCERAGGGDGLTSGGSRGGAANGVRSVEGDKEEGRRC